MAVEGIFRKNGNIRRLQQISEALDKDTTNVNLSDENPVQLAALLKRFLREMPDPLLTFRLHKLFCAAACKLALAVGGLKLTHSIEEPRRTPSLLASPCGHAAPSQPGYYRGPIRFPQVGRIILVPRRRDWITNGHGESRYRHYTFDSVCQRCQCRSRREFHWYSSSSRIA